MKLDRNETHIWDDNLRACRSPAADDNIGCVRNETTGLPPSAFFFISTKRGLG